MKKMILAFITIFLLIPALGCNRTIPDYSVEEAFDLMNEAITGYLESESIQLIYSGSYSGQNYNISEYMEISMKNMKSEDLIGKVEMNVTENDSNFISQVSYEDGVVYTERTMDGSTDYVKKDLEFSEYELLYLSFLKKTIDYDSTRNVSILVDPDTLTVYFELASASVESTFFVSNVFQTVNFATVSITLNHDAKLLSMNVEYNGTINSVVGKETYTITVSKLDQYVIINRLSASQKSLYQEDTSE